MMKQDNEDRRLTHQSQQHVEQTWSMEFVDNVELAASVPLALSALGLGAAAAYLEAHPEYLTVSLKHSDWTIRAAAVQVQGKQRRALEPLLNALNDENVSVRAAAARALGMQGEQAPIKPLVEALKDSEWRVRTAAAISLGKLKNRTPIEPLLPVLHDENASVRAATVWALGTLGQRAPVEHLTIALQDKAWAVREAAVMALQEQGEQAPFGSLLAARWDEDSSVRDATEATFSQHFDEQQGQGQKMVPDANGLSSSWQRLILAVISVVILMPLTSILTGDPYVGRFALVSETVATTVVCFAIALINILYQRKPAGSVSAQKHLRSKGGTTSWHNVALAGISVGVLTVVASILLKLDFVYNFYMTTDIVHSILICRLIALGAIAFTVVMINRMFFVRQ